MEPVMVQIGIKMYAYLPDTNQCLVIVPEQWDYSGGMNTLRRRAHSRLLAHHSERWFQVKKLALRK